MPLSRISRRLKPSSPISRSVKAAPRPPEIIAPTSGSREAIDRGEQLGRFGGQLPAGMMAAWIAEIVCPGVRRASRRRPLSIALSSNGSAAPPRP